MSTSPFSILGRSVLVSAFAWTAFVGCSGRTNPNPASGQSASASSPGTADPACAGRPCGADCTPSGSDEPFNCSATGACLATGQPLDCKKCPEFLGDCIAGQSPADLDGDGCIDGCAPTKK